MSEIKLDLNEKGHGAFFIMDGDEQLGEMVIGISAGKLTAYHTEVSTKAEGKGFAKTLLVAMVNYARKNGLKVVPLCPYVHAQFKRHPKEYADLWNEYNEMTNRQ